MEVRRKKNSQILWGEIKKLLPDVLEKNQGRAILSLYGGSGAGKTWISKELAEYLEAEGFHVFILAGDHYPHRIPRQNDAERRRVYECDGSKGLEKYLGTDKEIDYDAVNQVITSFRERKSQINIRYIDSEKEKIYEKNEDFSEIDILLIEWTHGNNERLKYIDIPIYLRSTPEETLRYRMERNRDADIDSPFTALVLKIEQKLLEQQISRAKIIMNLSGELSVRMQENHWYQDKNGPMLNAYPDSLGGKLCDIVTFLDEKNVKGAFQSFYILPSLYHSDLDRGFSVIDYDIDEAVATKKDLDELKALDIDLKLDFILNHASAQSPQFQNLVKYGEQSEYKDFFINWNEFWKGYGDMTEEGFIKPEEKYLQKMFLRKPELPILMVQFPDGKKVPYWNTFYQEERYPQYFGQMDLNIKSPLVWKFYNETLEKLAGYGANIVRLDAFAYAPKEPGEKNFLNEPGTWDLLSRIKVLADSYGLTLLPEIHASYSEGIYKKLAEKGYMTYDFFLPGLIIDAIENHRTNYLEMWAKEVYREKIQTVNMLGCHDGIPLLDLKGLLPEEDIQKLIEILISRGGYVKNLHGQKNIYYQVNTTYFSALGENENKFLLARAIQLFMPGKPQIWYLDLFAGKNDYDAVKKAGAGGHKEINRTNLKKQEIQELLQKDVVKKQLMLLKFRNSCKAFGNGASMEIEAEENWLKITWENAGEKATLSANMEDYQFEIKYEK